MTEHEAAKPKRPRDLEFEDAPQQESIRGMSPRTIRRNPSTDQKRVRREMQRKTASQSDALADALQKEAGDNPFGDWTCATPGCNKYDGMSAFRGDKYCKSCMKKGEPDKQRDAEQAKKRASADDKWKGPNPCPDGDCDLASHHFGPHQTLNYGTNVLENLKDDRSNARGEYHAPKTAEWDMRDDYDNIVPSDNCPMCKRGWDDEDDTSPSATACPGCGVKRGPVGPAPKKTAALPLPVDVPTPERKPELGDHKCQQCDYSGAPVLSQAGGYSCRNCGSYAINKVKVPKTAANWQGEPCQKCGGEKPDKLDGAYTPVCNDCWQAEAHAFGFHSGAEGNPHNPEGLAPSIRNSYSKGHKAGQEHAMSIVSAKGFPKGTTIPKDHPVQPIHENSPVPGNTRCNECGLHWDDNKVTSMTPVPSGRCPFEYYHNYDHEASKKTATQFDTQADKLNPGDMIRTPTGQTVKVLRMRNHETSGGHVYMDTDQGTSVVRRKSPVSIVPFNSQQQELPGYGTPGGNTNKLPMDSGNVGPSKRTPSGNNAPQSNDCPVCGGKGTLHRQGQQYVCSKCGYRENFGAAGPGEGYNFTDMTQNLRGTSSLTAIARRAQEVLEQTKENQ